MALGAIAGIATLVGTGISVVSQISQAKTQEKIARFNAQIEQGNARLQMLSQMGALQQQRAQSALALKQAEINFQMAQAEAGARDANAMRIRQAADARAASSREAIRRKRLDHARFMATQRAKIAASGVVDSTGSPLELLAETAGQMQLAVEEMHQEANIDLTEARNEATMENFGANLMRAGAGGQMAIERAAAGLRTASYGLDAARIKTQFRADRTASSYKLFGAQANTKGAYAAAAGTLLSGVGSYAQSKSATSYAGIR